MSDRTFRFYRCPDGTVAFDVAIAGGAMYRLDHVGMCPLCGTPVAEHERFSLRARGEESIEEEAA